MTEEGTQALTPILVDKFGVEEQGITAEELGDADEISVNIDGGDVVIPVSEHEQVYLIVKKEEIKILIAGEERQAYFRKI